ncbi:glycosyltransferase family protein [Vibrio bivalvicida]|uniref:Glycosyl transferase n=1 Tax=Vibrio bivalvicida TaxID=1276888 RepID=A0A177Y608_9VIBR|nr:glycosyltransferase [Vibrio bivalvicida]OAJ96284.1 glycosyl transferase [Vibrio bivalvicida]
MRDLIVFGEDFGGLPSSTQHLVTRLAKQRKVLWVNSIGLRQPKLTLHDIKRASNKLLGRSKGGFSDHNAQLANITVVNIKTIPAPRSWFARQLAKTMICSQLIPVIKKLGLNKPILWSSLPTTADLCGTLGESAIIYYCGDDFSSLAGVDHEVVATHEGKLVERADLILAASANLLAKFPQTKTHYLPHGVDTRLFSTPTERAIDLPSGDKKIAGFYGSLSNWLNYELIEQVCLDSPTWQFVFIGPIELPSNPLPKLPNVHYLGPKPHNVLPSYSQHWDVSLLPFKSNGQITACSPLKLLEYLAAGSKIIATPFPALSPYRQHVTVINNDRQFTRALNQLGSRSVNQGQLSVAGESWDARALKLNSMLESL